MRKKNENDGIVTIGMLYELASNYMNFSCKPENPKYKFGTIFDEDKSVKWNREEVDRRNKLHTDEVKSLTSSARISPLQ